MVKDDIYFSDDIYFEDCSVELLPYGSFPMWSLKQVNKPVGQKPVLVCQDGERCLEPVT